MNPCRPEIAEKYLYLSTSAFFSLRKVSGRLKEKPSVEKIVWSFQTSLLYFFSAKNFERKLYCNLINMKIT